MSLNTATIIGKLGADPDVKFTPSGQCVANFNVATDETWTDKDGQRQKRTEWHRIVVWGKTAELCGQFLAKGREVCVIGSIQTREWTDKDGGKRQTTEIRAERVVFTGNREHGERREEAPPQKQGGERLKWAGPAQPSPGAFTDDDLPF